MIKTRKVYNLSSSNISILIPAELLLSLYDLATRSRAKPE